MKTMEQLPENNTIDDYLEQFHRMTFDPFEGNDVISFYIWLNQFEYIADIIGVPNNEMGSLFVSMVDDEFRTRFDNSCPPVELSEISYEQIIFKYLSHLSPNRFDLHKKRFSCRIQYQQETIEQYANNLQKIYNMCFLTEHLDRELCKQFIYGIRQNKLRKQLESIPRLSFKEMVAKAIEFEDINKMQNYIDQACLKINVYNLESKCNFSEWLNQLENIINTLEIPENKRITFFNRMVDYRVYFSVKKRSPAVNFSALSYDEIKNLYINYFSQFDESSFHRERFKNRNQNEKETIKKYADNLREIFNKCNYKTDCEEKLCEQFINGIRDDELRNHLREISFSSFNEMVKEALKGRDDEQMQDYIDQAHLIINNYYICGGEFCIWLNKFEYVADTIGVPDNKMIEFFKKMVDDNSANAIHKNIANFQTLSYEQITDYYFRYHSLSRDNNQYKKRFKLRRQYQQETIEQYADNLQKLYIKCDYKKRCEKRLCEHFISGIIDDNIRSYLLTVPSSSFSEIVTKAINKYEQNLKKFRIDYRQDSILNS